MNKVVARYTYTDEEGNALYRVERLEPKTFHQSHPDGNGGWIYNLQGVQRVPYRAPELSRATRNEATVLIVEGEKDCETLYGLDRGLVATTFSGGSGGWRDDLYIDWFSDANVVIIPDNDEPGARYAQTIARSLVCVAKTVRVLTLPGLPEHGDVTDWLGAGGTADELEHLIAEAPPWGPPAGTVASLNGKRPGSVSDHDEPEVRKSASTRLVEIALAKFTFGVSDAGEIFAIPRSGPKVVSMLRGAHSLRGLCAKEYYELYAKAPPQQALADALLVTEGMAQTEDKTPLHVRVAEHEGALWLDLADQSGRAVCITADGWTLKDAAPVLFRRTPLSAPLPEPARDGNLAELWALLPVTEEDRPLLLAWCVAALHPNIPHPVMQLSGEQGSGKTTAAKIIVSTLDPSPVPTRKPPRDGEAWVTAASGSWVVALDNLSSISDWLSDSLCRAVTGEGDARRKLYADSDLVVFAFRRCVLLTGIDLGAMHGDLSDRLLPIHLDVISTDQRLEESELWPSWDKARPGIVGSLLDLVAGVKRVLPFVRLESKPRMADFARILDAVDRLLGTHGLDRYRDKQDALATESLTGDLFVMALQSTLGSNTFEGTSAELLAKIPDPDRHPRDWPANARQVTQRLNLQAPVMRRAGWIIDSDHGANKSGTRRWTIRRAEIARRRDPPDPPDPPRPSLAGQAGMAGQDYAPSLYDEDIDLTSDVPSDVVTVVTHSPDDGQPVDDTFDPGNDYLGYGEDGS